MHPPAPASSSVMNFQRGPWSLSTPCVCQLPSSWPCHGRDSSHWLPAPDHLYLSPEKSVCSTGSNSQNRTWNSGVVQLRKGVCQGCMLSLCLLNFCAKYIIWNAGLDEAQARFKISGRNNNNFRCSDDTTQMAKSEEGLKSLLGEVKEEWKL